MQNLFLLLFLIALTKSLSEQNPHQLDVYFLIETSDDITKAKFDVVKLELLDLITKLNPNAERLAILTTGKSIAILKKLDEKYSYNAEFRSYILSQLKQSKDSSIHRGLQVLHKMLQFEKIRSTHPKVVYLIAKNFDVDYFRRVINKIRRVSFFFILGIDQVNATQIHDSIKRIKLSRNFSLGLNERARVELTQSNYMYINTNIKTRTDKKIRIAFKVFNGSFLLSHVNEKNIQNQKIFVIYDEKQFCVEPTGSWIKFNQYFKLKGLLDSNSLIVGISEQISCKN